MPRTVYPISLLLTLLVSCLPGAHFDSSSIPRTVSIGDHISLTTCEVTVHEYMTFVAAKNFEPTLFPDPQAVPGPSYQAIMAVLTKPGLSGRKRNALYDSIGHAYGVVPLNLPVTGITYEQALRYCQWLEETTNAQRRRKPRVHIQLPSVEVYRHLLPNIDSMSPAGSKCGCNCFRFNYKHPPCNNGKGNYFDRVAGTTPIRVDAYWPSHEYLFNLQGNVAEMTSTKGIAMGGSFRQYAFECSREHQQIYTQPEDWLGFRYIVTLK